MTGPRRQVLTAFGDPRAAALATGGLVLTFVAPAHRIDLLGMGVLATASGIIWSPCVGPALIGLSLPFFFFARQLIVPFGVTPPVFVLIATWLAVLVRHRSLRLTSLRSPFDAALTLFLVAALTSLLVTEYPLLSVRELRALILEPVLFFLLLRTVPGSARLALRGFLLGATITSAAAILQIPLNLGGTAAEGVRRAQAWYPSANHLALMLGRALPFLVAAALGGFRWLWAPTFVVLVGLLLTFSTGGWLGGLAAVVTVVAAMARRRMARGVGAIAGAVLVTVSVLAIAGILPERLNPLRQTGGFRIDLWLSTINMIRDHPVLGVGLDNFAYLYQQVYLREGAAAEPNLSHPHNWLLHFWVELGVLGVIAFGALQVAFWRRARQTLSNPWSRWIVAGALGAMADLLVHGAIDNSYFLVDLAFVFWLTLALVADVTIVGA